MKKKLAILASVGLTMAPLFALAQSASGTYAGCGTAQTPGTIQYVICIIGNILGAVVPVLIALGIVYFVWGVVQYVIADSEEAKKKGKDHMIYGIIGLVAIVAMWGLVSLLTTTFGLNNNVNVQVPSINLH